MKKTIEIFYCDACGKEIGTGKNASLPDNVFDIDTYINGEKRGNKDLYEKCCNNCTYEKNCGNGDDCCADFESKPELKSKTSGIEISFKRGQRACDICQDCLVNIFSGILAKLNPQDQPKRKIKVRETKESK